MAKLSKSQLLQAYRTMRTIREFEERVHTEFATGEIPGSSTCTRARRLRPPAFACICATTITSPAPTATRALHREGSRPSGDDGGDLRKR